MVLARIVFAFWNLYARQLETLEVIMYVKRLIATSLLVLFSIGAWAQSTDIAGSYYTVEPDYRKCPSPYCGGWWLTKVNIYTVTNDSVLDASVAPIVPNPIYVVNIDYKALGLTDKQILEFENNIRLGRGFIRGVLRPYPTPIFDRTRLQTLAATGTWVAANDNVAYGPYMNVRSTGIVCITTPCPYYEVSILNTNYQTLAHELNLTRANLTDKQTALAWREVNGKGLILTGVRFPSQGQTGVGLGIAATKVFFTFPSPISVTP